MRKFSAASVLLLLLVMVAMGTTGCFDREPLFHASRLTGPTPPESVWVEVCDTTWTPHVTNDVQVNTTNRTATRIEGFSISCLNNLIRYPAVVVYSDTHDQTLRFYLEKVDDSNVKFYLADSTGSTNILQPQNYSGQRYMVLTASGIPLGTYALKMYYAGTITAPTRVNPTRAYNAQWQVTTPIDTLYVGCINCQTVKRPK